MNPAFNLSQQRSLTARQLYLGITFSTLKIVMAALLCVWLVQTEQLNYPHLFEYLIGSVLTDPLSINDYCTI